MEIVGEWRNQNGSILHVTEQDGPHFGGTFVSEKGRAAKGNAYPVRGVVNGEVVAFSVSFETEVDNLCSITNFTGRLARDQEGDVIHTVWVLARQFEDAARTKPTQPWNPFLTNSDVFRRIG